MGFKEDARELIQKLEAEVAATRLANDGLRKKVADMHDAAARREAEVLRRYGEYDVELAKLRLYAASRMDADLKEAAQKAEGGVKGPVPGPS